MRRNLSRASSKNSDQPKIKPPQPQIATIFSFLEKNVATASMVSEATGVPHKNLCRYKRDLEQLGRLWEVKKDYCKHTGFLAWYLTTDPSLAPKTSTEQLKLFAK